MFHISSKTHFLFEYLNIKKMTEKSSLAPSATELSHYKIWINTVYLKATFAKKDSLCLCFLVSKQLKKGHPLESLFGRILLLKVKRPHLQKDLRTY